MKRSEYWEHSLPMSFIEEQYSYWDKRKFRYELQDYMHETFQFNRFSSKSILELGCGAGIDSVEFARNGASVTSLDFTDAATRLTKTLFEEANLQGKVLRGDSTCLPFQDDSFDCVYSFGVLHHIPRVEVALAEIRRVLKPQGELMVMLYHKDSLLYGYSIAYLRGIKQGLLRESPMSKILARYSERKEDSPYTKAYTIDEAEELFEQYFCVDSIDVRYNVVDLLGRRKVKLSIPEELKLGWHLILKCRKN